MTVALAEIGHNNPPEPTPFEAIKVHIDDLMTEGRNWADGAAIETQAQADEVARLMDDFRKAMLAADEARKKENEPFDLGKAAVQAKYAPLIADTKTQRGCVVTAIEALKATLAPWLRKLEDEKRRAAEAARKAAQEAADKAAEAMRAAQATDLQAREAAELLVAQASRAESDARRAETDRAHAKGGDRATGLRSYFSPVMTDASAALKHYIATHPEAIKATLLALAKTDVQAGKRQIPGFDVVEERRVV